MFDQILNSSPTFPWIIAFCLNWFGSKLSPSLSSWFGVSGTISLISTIWYVSGRCLNRLSVLVECMWSSSSVISAFPRMLFTNYNFNHCFKSTSQISSQWSIEVPFNSFRWLLTFSSYLYASLLISFFNSVFPLNKLVPLFEVLQVIILFNLWLRIKEWVCVHTIHHLQMYSSEEKTFK